MKNALLRSLAAALSLLSALLLLGCGDNREALPPVVTQGIPEEAVKSSIVSDGFTIDLHLTYAEIRSYTGKDTVVTIPGSAGGLPVKLIGEAAFRGNSKLTKVILPDTVISIDRYAFEGCGALTEVLFNDGLEQINDYAFRNAGLTTLALPDSVSTIGKYSFYGTKITSLKIPESVSRMGKYAFYGCTELKTIEFCPRLSEIGERVFYNCTSLTELVIPKTVLELGNYAFSTCTSLKKIVIPAETVKIGEGVFVGCDALTVYAPAGSEAERNASRNGYRFEACDYDALTGGEESGT